MDLVWCAQFENCSTGYKVWKMLCGGVAAGGVVVWEMRNTMGRELVV